MSKVLELVKDIENGMNGGRYNLGPEMALTLTKIIRLQLETLKFYESGAHIFQESEASDVNVCPPIGHFAKQTLEETEKLAEGL